jgi:hypothetical protein
MVVALAAVAAAVAGVWMLAKDSGFRLPFAVALMVLAGVLSLTGGTAFARADSSDVRAFVGMGPEREGPADDGEGLTGVGVFLFVSLPLFAVGLLLFGTG